MKGKVLNCLIEPYQKMGFLKEPEFVGLVLQKNYLIYMVLIMFMLYLLFSSLFLECKTYIIALISYSIYTVATIYIIDRELRIPIFYYCLDWILFVILFPQVKKRPYFILFIALHLPIKCVFCYFLCKNVMNVFYKCAF